MYSIEPAETDAQDPDFGVLDQQHRFYYSAGWQIIEELIDEGWDSGGQGMPDVDRTVEYVWGARYIDDIVLRAVKDHGESTLEMFYHLTDHQFSTVALIDSAANLLERVSYDAYGMARHHWAADLTGDGAVNADDRAAMNATLNESIGDPDYNVDADITRTGTVTSSDAQYTTTGQYKAALPKGDLSAGIGHFNTIGYCRYVINPEVPTTGGGGGLYTVRFRHYDAELGRWLERDPLGYVDGMNLYEYVQGNSVSAYDPFGLATLYKRTGDGRYWPITEEEARKILERNGFVYVKDRHGNMRKAKRVGRQLWGNKSVVHNPHGPNQHVHVQHKNGGRGHINVPKKAFFVTTILSVLFLADAPANASEIADLLELLYLTTDDARANDLIAKIVEKWEEIYGSQTQPLHDAIKERWDNLQHERGRQRAEEAQEKIKRSRTGLPIEEGGESRLPREVPIILPLESDPCSPYG